MIGEELFLCMYVISTVPPSIDTSIVLNPLKPAYSSFPTARCVKNWSFLISYPHTGHHAASEMPQLTVIASHLVVEVRDPLEDWGSR